MTEVRCACGATYAPKDQYAVKRHETSTRHLSNVKEPNTMAEEAFSDLDDATPEEAPAPVAIQPKSKRARKSRVSTFADLDKTDAAKSFTEDERLSISTAIANSAGVHDLSQSAESIAQAFVDAAGNINEAIVDDLQTYVVGVVAVVRANGNGATPIESDAKPEPEPVDELDEPVEKPKPAPKAKAATPKAKAKPAPKAKAAPAKVAKPAKAAASGDKKACRVCSKVKPLEEFRKKSTRPDGRDTICATCAKAWDDAHKAVR